MRHTLGVSLTLDSENVTQKSILKTVLSGVIFLLDMLNKIYYQNNYFSYFKKVAVRKCTMSDKA